MPLQGHADGAVFHLTLLQYGDEFDHALVAVSLPPQPASCQTPGHCPALMTPQHRGYIAWSEHDLGHVGIRRRASEAIPEIIVRAHFSSSVQSDHANDEGQHHHAEKKPAQEIQLMLQDDDTNAVCTGDRQRFQTGGPCGSRAVFDIALGEPAVPLPGYCHRPALFFQTSTFVLEVERKLVIDSSIAERQRPGKGLLCFIMVAFEGQNATLSKE